MRKTILFIIYVMFFVNGNLFAEFTTNQFKINDFKWIESLQSYEQDEQGVKVKANLNSGEDVFLRIDVLDDYLVRIRANLDGVFEKTLQEKDGFVKSDWPVTDFQLIQETVHLKINTKGMYVVIDKNPFRISFFQNEKQKKQPLSL